MGRGLPEVCDKPAWLVQLSILGEKPALAVYAVSHARLTKRLLGQRLIAQNTGLPSSFSSLSITGRVSQPVLEMKSAPLLLSKSCVASLKMTAQ